MNFIKHFKIRKNKREYSDISFENMKKIYIQDKAILIDVRSRQEYNENHYDGAINIPLDEISEKIKKVVTDKGKTIILYCQYGTRSKKAQKILQKMGYEKIYNLKNGMELY